MVIYISSLCSVIDNKEKKYMEHNNRNENEFHYEMLYFRSFLDDVVSHFFWNLVIRKQIVILQNWAYICNPTWTLISSIWNEMESPFHS